MQEVTNNRDQTGVSQRDQVQQVLDSAGYQLIEPEDDQCDVGHRFAGDDRGHSPCDNSALLAWRTRSVTVAPSSGLPMTGLYLAGSIASTDVASDSRAVPWAFLQHEGGPTFLVIGVHTLSEKTPWAEAGRVAFARSVTGWATSLAAARGLRDIPMFLAGDLNSYAFRQPQGAQKQLTKAGWKDAYYAAPTRVGARYATINVTPQIARFNGFPPRPYAYGASREPTRIDYLFFRNAKALSYETVVRLNANGTFIEGLRMSDHNAIRAAFAF
jgi:hypothetical protein